MAIALDSNGSVSLSGSGPYTGTINNVAGNILWVTVNGDIDDLVSGVTYNSVAMTQVQKANGLDGVSRWQYLYMLVGPATGSNTLSISVSGTNIGIAASLFVSFTGAAQTGQPDASGNNTTNSVGHTSQGKSITTIADNSWWVGLIHTNVAVTQTATGGTILDGNSSSHTSYYSAGGVTPAGTATIGATFSAATISEAIIASFAPAAVVATINVFDSVTVSENIVAGTNNLQLSVFDSVTVAETIIATSGPQQLSVFDSITVAEAITVNEANLVISVFDSITVAEAAPLLDLYVDSQQDISGGSQGILGNAGGTDQQELAQSFFAASTYYLSSVSLFLTTVGSPTDSYGVELRSGSTTGTLLGTSTFINSSSIGTNAWINFSFATPILINEVVTEYFIVVRRTGARDTSNYIAWFYSGSDVIPGDPWDLGTAGWVKYINIDFSFKTYEDTNLDIAVSNNIVVSGNIIDFYPETYQTAGWNLYSTAEGIAGQTFTGNGGKIGSAQFFIKKLGAPPNNMVAKIYAITGTFGVNATPTGVALATSDNVALSTITTSYALITFNFSGANKITLTAGTNYGVSVEYQDVGGDGSNHPIIGYDGNTLANPGNDFYWIDPSWHADNLIDYIFYVREDVTESTVEEIYNINIFDSITVTESIVAGTNNLKPSVFDSITVAENINADTNNFQLSVFDSITVSESTIASPGVLNVVISDDIQVSESISAEENAFNINAFDSVTVAETTIVEEANLDINIFDSVVVSEATTVTEVSPGQINISITDDIFISENISMSESTITTVQTGFIYMPTRDRRRMR